MEHGVRSGGITIGIGINDRKYYNHVIHEYLANMVALKFSAEEYRNMVVANGTIKILTKGSAGSLKFSREKWIVAVEKATQVIISVDEAQSYIKTQYRRVQTQGFTIT